MNKKRYKWQIIPGEKTTGGEEMQEKLAGYFALLLYAAFRLPAILAVAITLCAVLALQLLLLAAANRYYEKRL